MVHRCKEMEQEYTGNSCTRHLGQPYLLSNLYELNILCRCNGKQTTNHLINCHRHHKVFNAVCKSTVNLDFFIIQLNRTRIQKIQQGTKNEGKWTEARQRKKNNG